MIIADAQKIAFIHIPKCGGTSVRAQLSGIDSTGGQFVRVAEHPVLGQVHMAHLPLAFLAEQFPEEFAKISSYRSFALVREPYARFASAVFQRLEEFKGVAKLQTDVAAALREAHEVIRWLSGRRAFCDAQFIHFSRQVDYVDLNGARVVSDVFALDDVARFASALAAASGVKLDAEQRINSNFASSNPVLAFVHGAKPVYSRLTTWAFRRRVVVTLQKMGLYTPDRLYAGIMRDPQVRAFVDHYYADDFALHRSLVGRGAQSGMAAGAQDAHARAQPQAALVLARKRL